MQGNEENRRTDVGEHTTKMRWVLLGAFGGMLLLMILAGLDSLRTLNELNQISNDVAQQFSRRRDALVTVVVLYHSYTDQMEQYLLSDAVASDMPGAAEITKRGVAVHTAIGKYPQNCGPDERSLLGQIENDIRLEESFFSSVLANGQGAERKRFAHSIVEQELVPTRIHVLQLANSLSALDERKLGEQNQALSLQFRALEARLTRTVVLVLVAGLLLSLVSGYYILQLEQRGRERYVALARSREELESLSRRLVDAQEAERRSISRELHDEVGQTLGALLMDIGHLSSLLAPGDRLVDEQITRIRAAAETAVKSIRDMALLLRPPMLDDLGLVPALEWQARETSRRGDMEVELHAEELANDPPNAVKVCVYRVVQEALRNAATHAHAKNAKVVLKKDDHKVTVEIGDDGVGFQPERTRGMGILGMEERVRQLEGTFFVRSTPGKGTTVHAELPLDGGG
jgi:signal transduction histidine kinase